MKLKMIATIIMVSFFLFACSSDNNESSTGAKEVENIKELVHDYSVGNLKSPSASIRSHELIITNLDQSQEIYALPEDEFFVSIAPFINQTHPWTYHNLVGCQGEMVEQEFLVYIEDNDGNVVVDDTVKSLANGFIDLWLPRDKTYQIKIEYDGKTVESQFSTFEGDATCITTMQLS